MKCLAVLEYFYKGSMVEFKQSVVRIEDLICQTFNAIKEIGYTSRYLEKFTYTYKLFMEYARQHDCHYYSETLVLAFLEEKCKIFSDTGAMNLTRQSRKRAISKLDEMYKYNQVTSKKLLSRKQYQFNSCFQSSIMAYIAWKSATVSPARIQSIKLYLERLSHYIANTNTLQCEQDLRSKHLLQFLETCAIYTHNTLYATAVCLRGYIVYLEHNGYLSGTISTAIPRIAKQRDRSYPSAFTTKETQALLGSIRRENAKERRDYAMLLLAARLGLRASDIANLQFSNIHWESNRITLVQQKTQTSLVLPLLKDVGEAIIDYLKHGRPHVNEPHIFIRETRPYTKINGASLHMIVDGYLKRANIKIPAGKKHGPHALRHSLATLLLEENIPISTIKEILAHKSSETTKVYLKVAQRQLLECALEVPSISTHKEASCTKHP